MNNAAAAPDALKVVAKVLPHASTSSTTVYREELKKTECQPELVEGRLKDLALSSKSA